MIDRITLGDLTLHTPTKLVEWGDRKFFLTPSEFLLFVRLLLCGRSSHTQLYSALYGLDPCCLNDAYEAVSPIITRLRKKVPDGLIARGKPGSREYFLAVDRVGVL